MEEYTKTRLLVTVMTYPLPSRGYQELVCTAGISETGDWIRLYPVDYRYRPRHQQFRKYQWIEVDLAHTGSGNDNRLESRRPNLDSIRILGDPLPTSDSWRARREVVDGMPVYTRKQLEALYEKEKRSLGIVRPVKVVDLDVEPLDREWKPEWQQILRQFDLFKGRPKELKRIPFRFSYVFSCEDSHSTHTAMVEDWELGVLFLKEADRLGDETKAAQSVRRKYLDEMCHESRDTLFFMGTTWPYNSWVVLGVFWPPKATQMELL